MVFLVMDPGYNEINHAIKLRANAALLHIPITDVRGPMFSRSPTGSEKNPCYLCCADALRYLYSKAQELGCNKIALGHPLQRCH